MELEQGLGLERTQEKLREGRLNVCSCDILSLWLRDFHGPQLAGRSPGEVSLRVSWVPSIIHCGQVLEGFCRQ